MSHHKMWVILLYSHTYQVHSIRFQNFFVRPFKIVIDSWKFSRRTRHAGHCWRSKDELISDVLQWTPANGQAKAGRPARTYIQQLCEDTGCNPEDLLKSMNDRVKWREMVSDICAGGTTIYLMRWLTNFYDFSFKRTTTAAIGIHPTKAWLSPLVNFKNAIFTWGYFRRTICNKILF